MLPRLSVIVPIYKVEPFLERCIKSIQDQSYPNLEIILVDDGSPDNCPYICDKLAKEDSRIKVIHKKNGGQSSARNAGIDLSTGDYLTFVDPDDWVERDCYSLMMHKMIDNQCDIIGGGYCYYRPWKIENKRLSGNLDGSFNIITSEKALHQLYFGAQMFDPITIMVWNKIYRKQLFDNLRFLEGYIQEDVLITPILLHKASKIGCLNTTVYNYNIHLGASSTSGLGDIPLRVHSTLKVNREVYRYFKEHSVNPQIINRVTGILANTILENYYICRNNRRVSEEWSNLFLSLKDVAKEAKGNIFNECRSHQVRIFEISPWLYCTLKTLLRTTKKSKYKLYCLLTGKN